MLVALFAGVAYRLGLRSSGGLFCLLLLFAVVVILAQYVVACNAIGANMVYRKQGRVLYPEYWTVSVIKKVCYPIFRTPIFGLYDKKNNGRPSILKAVHRVKHRGTKGVVPWQA